MSCLILVISITIFLFGFKINSICKLNNEKNNRLKTEIDSKKKEIIRKKTELLMRLPKIDIFQRIKMNLVMVNDALIYNIDK
jgi:hypothetical protein